MNKHLIEIVQHAIKANQDPIALVLDYMQAKDSRITRTQAERIVNKIKSEL